MDQKIQNPKKHRKLGKRNARPKGVHDKALRPRRDGRPLPENNDAFAEYALRHADEALDVLVDIMHNSGSKVARASAAKRILKRAFGKAPKHIDTTAIKHTEIVYRSLDEIRMEMARRGLPSLIEHGISDKKRL